MEYIKKEFKRLGSMSLILVGAFLVLEHIFTYGGIEFWDLLGHEWFGMVLIIAGFLTANKWGEYSFSKGWFETKEKIKFVFGKN